MSCSKFAPRSGLIEIPYPLVERPGAVEALQGKAQREACPPSGNEPYC